MARELKDNGLLKSKSAFLLAYQLFYHPQGIKAGEYAFSPPLRAKDIIESLVEGRIYLHSLTIPEGLTAKEIYPLLATFLSDEEEDFFRAFREVVPISSFDPEAADLEGYLFPETYHFPKGIVARDVIQAMLEQFKSVFMEPWKVRARSLGMTIREVVTLASLVEKETSMPEERKLISAVFHNRLQKGMKLDCDPSIIYILKQKDAFDGNLRKKDMKLDSPYNTYLYPGLPPGPICNPGRDSLEAALYPEEEGFLYFVSRNDGSHHFSRTFAEHQQAVRKYQLRLRQSPGP